MDRESGELIEFVTSDASVLKGPNVRTRVSQIAAIGLPVFFVISTAGDLARRIRAEDSPQDGKPLFNGKDFSGWEGDLKLWKIEDDRIVGDSPGIEQNEFLATRKTYRNFELELEFRLKDGLGNTGVQFRSQRVPESRAVTGYQADIGEKYWGCLYDEHRRNKILAQAPKELEDVLKKNDWNRYFVRADGDHILLKVNGLTTVDYRETDSKIPREGIIALQVHSGPAMRIEFRNIRLKELP